MVSETIKKKRIKSIARLNLIKIDIKRRKLELKNNLKYINDILLFLKKIKKVEHCFNYIKANWYFDKKYEDEIRNIEERITIYSNLYEKEILKRKILKLKLKQAQREFSKRQKSHIEFEKKYFDQECKKNEYTDSNRKKK